MKQPIQTLLGIDLGASSLKTSLIDAADGTVIATANCPITTYTPKPGWVEQDPEQWYQALVAAVRRTLNNSSLPKHVIQGLAISAGAHIPVLLDADNRVIRPAIMWSDQRSAAEAAHLDAQNGELILQQSLNKANPTWTLAMLKWLQQHEPASLQHCRRLCLAKDYLRWRLTGQWMTDFSDVVGALMANNETRHWSPQLAALVNLPLDILPDVLPATARAGEVTQQAAQETGLSAGLAVVVGSNDTTVELFGVGAVAPGQAALKLASAGVLYMTVAEPERKPPISCYPHLLDGYYYLASGTNSCAVAHRWACEQLFKHEDQTIEQSFAEMDKLAGQVDAGSEGLLFHPYLQGERAPYWDPQLRADFIGMTIRHSKAHLARAVYEGVAFSLRDLIAAAQQEGLQFDTLRLLGGGARSAVWRQIIADITGCRLQLPAQSDASFASALVAGIGVGVFVDYQDALARCVSLLDETVPEPQRQQRYDELFAIYQAGQRALAPLSHRLHAFALS